MIFLSRKKLDDSSQKTIETIARNHPQYAKHFKTIALKDKKCTADIILSTYEMVVRYKHLLRSKSINVFEFKKLEELYDAINAEAIKNEKAKYAKSFISKKYEHLLDEEAIELFYTLKRLRLSKNDINAIVMKGAYKFKNPQDLKDSINNFINNFGSTIKSKIDEIEQTNATIEYISHAEKILIAKIPDFKTAKALGASSWCICRSQSFWDRYTNSDNHDTSKDSIKDDIIAYKDLIEETRHFKDREDMLKRNPEMAKLITTTHLYPFRDRKRNNSIPAEQFFIWDYSKQTSDPDHLYGVTMCGSRVKDAYSQDNMPADKNLMLKLMNNAPKARISFQKLFEENRSKFYKEETGIPRFDALSLVAWTNNLYGAEDAAINIVKNINLFDSNERKQLHTELGTLIMELCSNYEEFWSNLCIALDTLETDSRKELTSDLEEFLKAHYKCHYSNKLIEVIEALQRVGSKLSYKDIISAEALSDPNYLEKLYNETGHKINVEEDIFPYIFQNLFLSFKDSTQLVKYMEFYFENDLYSLFKTKKFCENILYNPLHSVNEDVQVFLYQKIWENHKDLSERILFNLCQLRRLNRTLFLGSLRDSTPESEGGMIFDILESATSLSQSHSRKNIAEFVLDAKAKGFKLPTTTFKLLAEIILAENSEFSIEDQLYVCQVTDISTLNTIQSEGVIKLNPMIEVMLQKIAS